MAILGKALQIKERVVVVSNSVQALNVIEGVCRKQSWTTVRIDGSMAADQRQSVVVNFNLYNIGQVSYCLCRALHSLASRRWMTHTTPRFTTVPLSCRPDPLGWLPEIHSFTQCSILQSSDRQIFVDRSYKGSALGQCNADLPAIYTCWRSWSEPHWCQPADIARLRLESSNGSASNGQGLARRADKTLCGLSPSHHG